MVGSYAALSGDDGTEEPLLGGRKTKKKKMVKHRIVAVSANRGITETPKKLERRQMVASRPVGAAGS